MRRTTTLRLAVLGAAAAAALVSGGTTAAVSASAATSLPAVAECAPGGAGLDTARVRDGSTAKEPELYTRTTRRMPTAHSRTRSTSAMAQ